MSYRYMQIVEHFQTAIGQGTLGAGQKLPSLRVIRERFQCALSVAQQAYTELLARGLVRSVEKTGYFVCAGCTTEIPKIPSLRVASKPFTPSTSDLVGRVMELANRPEIIPLSGAIPHSSLLPLLNIKRHMLEVQRKNPEILAQYTPALGSTALRKELAVLMIAKGVRVHPGQILVTNGCSEALRLAIDACSKPGDAIAIESPAFFGMVSMLELMGRNVIGIPVKAETGMDIDYLEQVLQNQKIKACMVTPNFQNPIGALMPDENKKRLCRLAQQFQFYVIEDDIYGDCCHGTHAPSPLKSFDVHERVVYCASFAKSLAPGLRLGFCIPGPLLQQMGRAKQRSTLGGPALMQETLAQFLASGGYQRHLLKFRKAVCNQVHQFRELMLHCFPEGTKISQPVGGFFLWVQLPSGCRAMNLFEAGLNHKIGVIPGNAFSLRGSMYHDSIRISCASPLDARIQKALETLGKLCAASIEGK